MDKAILELYDKFGVDIEKLIPQVIQHGQTSSGVALKVSVIGAVVLTAIIVGLLFIRKKGRLFFYFRRCMRYWFYNLWDCVIRISCLCCL